MAKKLGSLVGKKNPDIITVSGPTHNALNEAAVLIKNGYVFADVNPFENLASIGHLIINLQKGEPTAFAEEAANATVALTIEMEEFKRTEEIKAEAKRLVEQEKKDAHAKQIAEKIMQQKKELAALQAQMPV